RRALPSFPTRRSSDLTLNEVLDLHEHVVRELERTSAGVGKLGRFEQRASTGRGAGSWASCIDSVNTLVGDLVRPSKEMARVMAGDRKSTRLNSSHVSI